LRPGGVTESPGGRMKTVGVYHKIRFIGLERVGWGFTLTMAAYNLVRMSNLLPQATETRS
jgi:hypothetical protein